MALVFGITAVTGRRRSLGTAVGIARTVRGLNAKQLAVWFRQGLNVLFTRGPKATMYVNHLGTRIKFEITRQ